MPDVVSFRVTDEELEIIDRTRRQLGLATRADAVRYLVKQGAMQRASFRDSPLGRFRLPKRFHTARTWSGQEIDAYLYDDAEKRE
jgi:hypothetical protein